VIPTNSARPARSCAVRKRVHHRPEHPARWRRLPGHAVGIAGQFALSDTGAAHLAVEKATSSAPRSSTAPVRTVQIKNKKIRTRKNQNKKKGGADAVEGRQVKDPKVVELETTGSTRFLLPLASQTTNPEIAMADPPLRDPGRPPQGCRSHALVVETPSGASWSTPDWATTSRAAMCRPGITATALFSTS